MIWQCKLCSTSVSSRPQLFKHYRLSTATFPELAPFHASIMISLNALRTHLSRTHTAQLSSSAEQSRETALFKCPLCTFQQPFSESVFCHLRRHLKNHETVACPYRDCNYSTNVYSSFNSHKSRAHQASLTSDFQSAIVSEDPQNLQASISEVTGDLDEECPGQSTEVGDDDQCDTVNLRNQLKMNVSSLFLKMQAILHVSNTATQEIVDHLNQIFSLSQPLIKEAVSDILQRNGHNIAEPTLDEVVSAVIDSNILFTATSKGAELSSYKRRKTFIEHNYPCVMPVEYQLEQPGHTVMYVPILQMIQELFRNTDILNKITEPNTEPGQYVSCSDGSHFLENELLSTGDLILPLQLYIDDLEIANPLGTSRKIHKLCAVYWVLANVSPKYRSALHAIQLAILVKVTDLRKYGYAAVLAPLLHDVRILEEDGVFIERVGQNVKGTIFCVSADNLAAHGLSGFVESFKAGYLCRFCMATREEFQATEPKTEASRVDSVLVSALPEVAQAHIRRQTTSDIIYHTSNVTIDGTNYVCGMFVSVGASGGLSTFCKIEQIYLVNHSVSFLCSDYDSWYVEHIRSYELLATRTSLSIHLQSDLNDTVPLSAYKIGGSLLLTPKRFLQVKQN
ncbi:hypothetical protein F7725_008588 [Dissostichus mawsoni]|uniref:C2H2-type domain-containing protein n=1 Tax=Dissostichus mawsoni TaxID=36200 RepID=A0A7J5Y7L7_DISMA|nr:hypothetical protein F7725_008588 [Dissostichus mawsoni]